MIRVFTFLFLLVFASPSQSLAKQFNYHAYGPTIQSYLKKHGRSSIRSGVTFVLRESPKSKRAFAIVPAHVVAGADSFRLTSMGIANGHLSTDPKLLGMSPTLDLAVFEVQNLKEEKDSSWVFLSLDQATEVISKEKLASSGQLYAVNLGEQALRFFFPWANKKRWAYEIKNDLKNSPIYPISSWIEIHDSDLRPGQSGSILSAETGKNQAMSVGIFTRALAQTRMAVGIPMHSVLSYANKLKNGIDPFRKENPSAPYVEFVFNEHAGWLKTVVFPKAFTSRESNLRLTEVCGAKGYVDSGGGDWTDGDGPSNQFFMLFRLGKVFQPTDRCNGMRGLLTDNGKLITGYLGSNGVKYELKSIDDLRRIRSSSSEFTQFWKSKH